LILSDAAESDFIDELVKIDAS
jgi:hypothetical protein